ncbi:phosphotransferase [Actinokineospora fastidiosa]|uniref:phosphotransferase n=1 Tax=Actinokineospora fastidiosa TaxID=1816 RepID=UPI0016714B3C|nr:phosphotransferase [Actinokineospora fastidiosa]
MDRPAARAVNLAEVEWRMTRRYGAGIADWLARLPALLDRVAADWGLVLGEPFGGGNSGATVRAWRDGVPVVLKVFPEQATAARGQAEVLRAFGPSGRVPRLLAAEDGALLMAHVDGVPGWPEPAEFAALLADLHAVAPIDRPDLVAGTTGFLGRARPEGPVTADDLAAARTACAAMAATVDRAVLLHGDLHRDNLLIGARPVVIDPFGTLGEPEFDAVDYVLDGPAIENRRDALLAVSDLRPDRLDGWCRAVAAVVAIGAFRKGGPTDELMDYARSAPRSR